MEVCLNTSVGKEKVLEEQSVCPVFMTCYFMILGKGFPGGVVAKNLPANAGNIKDVGSIPGSGRSPGRGHGNPLQYTCLEHPVYKGAWQFYSS